MRPILIPFLLFTCRLAQAQSACPTVRFQGAIAPPTVSSSSSSTVVTRQPDGSYTAYELSTTSPYEILNTTPNYAAGFEACLPPRGSGTVQAPSRANFGNPPGSGSSPFAILPSGNYLVVAAANNNISVTEFDPTMRFISQSLYPVPTFNGSVLITDLDGDGNPDLVCVSSGAGKGIVNGSLYVLLGSGGTSFQTPQVYAISATSSANVAAGDFNGDGKIDLAATSFGFDFSGGHVSIFFGNGDGTFQSEQVRFPGTTADGIAIGDLNGDGKTDLVFTLAAYAGNPQAVMVAFGNGDGTFSAGTQYVVAGEEVSIGDANGDGIPDIIASGSVLFGDGKGNFPTRHDYDVGGPLLFDFDGDGIPDLISASGNAFIFSGPSSVVFGEGGGKFAGEPASQNNGGKPILADFNEDGNLDIATLGQKAVNVLAGEGDGTFQPMYSYDTVTNLGMYPVSMTAGDFNGDGHVDLAVAIYGGGEQGNVLLLLGDGHGKFSLSDSEVPVVSPYGIATADFNGDGLLDLAITSGTDSSSSGTVTILLGDGHGNFNSKSNFVSAPVPFGLLTGDFNGDGKPDLAITNQGVNGPSHPNANVSVFLGKGDGTFIPGVVIPTAPFDNDELSNMVTADFNRDGKLDLAVPVTTGLLIALGKGDGTFFPATTYPADTTEVTVADVNGDGVPDLVLSGGSGDTQSTVGYLLGNGDGTFQTEVAIPADVNGLGAMIAADLNHDGTIDLAGVGGPLGLVTLLNLTKPPSFTLVSSASFAISPAAPDSMVTAFGKNLTTTTVSAGSSALPFTLGGTSVAVGGIAAPLLYVSPSQINFEVPPGIATGIGNVIITAPNNATLTAPMTIQPVAPSIFIQDASGIAVADLVSITNGIQTITTVPGPISLAPDSVYLVLYGTGIRGADGNVTATIDGTQASVAYAGPQPDFPGLDQVNILLPRSLAGGGLVSIVLSASGIESNTVHVAIQ
jgi:uncharacterized protein (TIGR03437 family)